MAIGSSNLPKIEVGVAKEKYESDTNSSTSKKQLRLQHLKKNYFGSDSNHFLFYFMSVFILLTHRKAPPCRR